MRRYVLAAAVALALGASAARAQEQGGPREAEGEVEVELGAQPVVEPGEVAVQAPQVVGRRHYAPLKPQAGPNDPIWVRQSFQPELAQSTPD